MAFVLHKLTFACLIPGSPSRARLATKAHEPQVIPSTHSVTLASTTTYATELYRSSKDIRMVQKALGHASLSTTMIYTHIVDDDMEEAMRAFNI